MALRAMKCWLQSNYLIYGFCVCENIDKSVAFASAKTQTTRSLYLLGRDGFQIPEVAGGVQVLKAKGRRRRKFKPRKLLKRLLVLAVLLALGTGFFLLGRTAFRLVNGWRNRPSLLTIAQAEQVDNIPGIAAEAVLLRQEVVVLADKPGQANLLVDAGSQVESGNLVLELVDKDLLAQTDVEIQKLEKGVQQGTPNSQSLVDITTKLTTSQSKLYEAMDSYKQALRVQAVQTYSSLYNSLTKVAKEVVQLQQDYSLLAKSQVATAEQRHELEQRRQQAIVPVHTPAAGSVYYWVDGLEEVAKATNITSGFWEQLQAAKKAKVYQTAGDSSVAAGQPVFKVAVDSKSYLLARLTTENAVVPPEWKTVSLRWQNGAQEAMFSANIVEHKGLEAGQLLLQLPADEAMVLPRFLEISLHKDGEVYCSIPLQAVVTLDGQTAVFILEGNMVKAQPVEVLQQQTKKNVIVAGMKPGMSFVTKPEGLSDGQDVTDRLRK